MSRSARGRLFYAPFARLADNLVNRVVNRLVDRPVDTKPQVIQGLKACVNSVNKNLYI